MNTIMKHTFTTLLLFGLFIAPLLKANEFKAQHGSGQEWLDAIDSSLIASANYEAETKVLRIKFRRKTGHSSATYRYLNVPNDVWKRWQDADSKGKYYLKWVKQRQWEKATAKLKNIESNSVSNL